jgi:hypothetical protein
MRVLSRQLFFNKFHSEFLGKTIEINMCEPSQRKNQNKESVLFVHSSFIDDKTVKTLQKRVKKVESLADE